MTIGQISRIGGGLRYILSIHGSLQVCWKFQGVRDANENGLELHMIEAEYECRYFLGLIYSLFGQWQPVGCDANMLKKSSHKKIIRERWNADLRGG
jgi:hypothetical protein